MNRTITKLANELTYKGALKCGNETIAHATYAGKSAATSAPPTAKWLQRMLSTHIEQSVCFLNTGNVYRQCTEYMAALHSNDPLIEMAQYVRCDEDGPTTAEPNKADGMLRGARLYSNYCEAGILLQVIGALKAAGVRGADIGVIAPYVLQVELLKQIIHKCEGNEDIEVNTVDQYQGRDKEVRSGFHRWLRTLAAFFAPSQRIDSSYDVLVCLE